MLIKNPLKLVCNHTAIALVQYVVANKAAPIRKAKMEGRDYVVVPVVMIKEGVFNGSNGALFYPADELKKVPAVWNGKPIVVYHPEINGAGVSACSPEIFSSHKVGVLMNTRFDNKKRLVADAFIDPERADAVDKRIMNTLKDKKMMEVSTGLFTDNEEVEGEFEGRKYKAIARNYKPDHLALLPDKVGACSIEDGAGLLRNELQHLAELPERVRAIAHKALIDALTANDEAADVLANELSHETKRGILCEALRKKFPPPEGNDKGYAYPWIEAVFDTFFVYAMGAKTFKLNYSEKGNEVKLDGVPSEVVRVTEYKPVGVANVGTPAATNNTKDPNNMNKTGIIAAIIALNCGWSKEDEPALNAMEEVALNKIKTNAEAVSTANAEKAAFKKKAAADEEAAAEAAAAKKKTTNEQAPVPQTVEQYINAAPQGMREVLLSANAAHTQQKIALIATITANARNVFTKELLEKKSLEELQGIAALARNEDTATNPGSQANFYGGLAPVGNSNKEVPKVEAMPTINWDVEVTNSRKK